MITPYELSNINDRADIKRDLIYLENIIDNHLYKFYENSSSKIPGLELDRLNINVEELLVDLYDKNGWTIYFEVLEDKNKYILYIKEKV